MLWREIVIIFHTLMMRILQYWRSIAVACVILYGCLLREPRYTLPPIEGGDKWVHFLMYALFAYMLIWDAIRDGLRGWRLVLLTLVFPIMYGGLIEIIQEQWFYPRTGDWYDWLADSVGVVLGLAIWMMIDKIRNVRRTDK